MTFGTRRLGGVKNSFMFVEDQEKYNYKNKRKTPKKSNNKDKIGSYDKKNIKFSALLRGLFR